MLNIMPCWTSVLRWNKYNKWYFSEFYITNKINLSPIKYHIQELNYVVTVSDQWMIKGIIVFLNFSIDRIYRNIPTIGIYHIIDEYKYWHLPDTYIYNDTNTIMSEIFQNHLLNYILFTQYTFSYYRNIKPGGDFKFNTCT